MKKLGLFFLGLALITAYSCKPTGAKNNADSLTVDSDTVIVDSIAIDSVDTIVVDTCK